MPTEPLDHLSGCRADRLNFDIGCPSCSGPLTVVNGARRTLEDVGREVFIILACKPCRQTYEVHMNMNKINLPNPKLSGAQQRAERKEARERELAW